MIHRSPMTVREAMLPDWKTAEPRLPNCEPYAIAFWPGIIPGIGCAITSTRVALNSGLVNPAVSSMVPAPGVFDTSPGAIGPGSLRLCASTTNHPAPKRVVYALFTAVSMAYIHASARFLSGSSGFLIAGDSHTISTRMTSE